MHRIEGLTGMSALTVRGFGRGRPLEGEPPIEEALELLRTHVKVEIVCLDSLAERVVEAIQSEAHTGLRGDGKIYVCCVEDAHRISTGERGDPAV